MSRNESLTCRELIEPALKKAGWSWERQVFIGPGRVNLVGESMYDPSQRIVARCYSGPYGKKHLPGSFR